jgi:pyruvate-formate lyase-activating enzyme
LLLKNIVAVPTWRCNFTCSYCDYRFARGQVHLFYKQEGHKVASAREVDPKDWLERLRGLEPFHLEFTGGEPTLYSGFSDIIRGLPAGCTWGITTNLSNPQVFNGDGVRNCRGITATFHPGARYPYSDIARFLQNMAVVRSKGYPIKATLVVTPDDVDELEERATIIAQNFQLNINLYCTIGYTWPADKLEKVKPFEHLLNPGTLDHWPDNEGEAKRCCAGGDYLFLMSDLSVYPCYSRMIDPKEKPLAAALVNPIICMHNCAFECDQTNGVL